MMAKNQEQIQYLREDQQPNPAYASYRAMMAKNRTTETQGANYFLPLW